MTGGIGCFVLARDEAANIGRCVGALSRLGIETTVLDSGSSDETAAIAAMTPGVRVEQYDYVNHCAAYNDITRCLGSGLHAVMVLDADMIVSGELVQEALGLVSDGRADVVCAPVTMAVEGHVLRHGSLCPPKPFVFRPGNEYFVPRGHGEALRPQVRTARTRLALVHDDRKPYSRYLASQARYAENLQLRLRGRAGNLRDRLRAHTPILLAVVPFVSYVLKGGFLAGRPGLIYALDRLIAEAVMYRESLAEGLRTRKDTR